MRIVNVLIAAWVLAAFSFVDVMAQSHPVDSTAYLDYESVCYVTSDPESSEPIQDTFFGARFGTSLRNAKELLSSMGIVAYAEYGKIRAYDVMFGGRTWDYLQMYFNNSGMYEVEFSMNFQVKDDAKSAFDRLSSSLGRKYAIVDWYRKHELEEIIYADSSYRKCCFLTFSYSISKGGDWYYYVHLTYTDIKLQEASEDEL